MIAAFMLRLLPHVVGGDVVLPPCNYTQNLHVVPQSFLRGGKQLQMEIWPLSNFFLLASLLNLLFVKLCNNGAE